MIDKLPDTFPYAFFGELVSVFGPSVMDEEEEGFVLHYIGGTAGWYAALKATCEKLGLTDWFKAYDELQWYESDELDSDLEDLVIQACVPAKWGTANPYYQSLLHKGETA